MFLTIAQTAEYLNISKKQVERLCRTEDFPNPYSFGKKAYRFDETEINQWVKTRKTLIDSDVKVIPEYSEKNPKKAKKLDTKSLNEFLDNHANRSGLLNGTGISI